MECFSYNLYRLFQTPHSFSDNFYPRFPSFFYSAVNKLDYVESGKTDIDDRLQYHLCLLFLVRPAGYIVNLSDFYSYRLIGKLTVFLQLQEPRLGCSFTYQLKY